MCRFMLACSVNSRPHTSHLNSFTPCEGWGQRMVGPAPSAAGAAQGPAQPRGSQGTWICRAWGGAGTCAPQGARGGLLALCRTFGPVSRLDCRKQGKTDPHQLMCTFHRAPPAPLSCPFCKCRPWSHPQTAPGATPTAWSHSGQDPASPQTLPSRLHWKCTCSTLKTQYAASAAGARAAPQSGTHGKDWLGTMTATWQLTWRRDIRAVLEPSSMWGVAAGRAAGRALGAWL